MTTNGLSGPISRTSRTLTDWAIGRLVRTAVKQGRKKGVRTLDRHERRLARAIFVVTGRKPDLRYVLGQEARAEWRAWVTTRKLARHSPNKFLNDALSNLRQMAKVWGDIVCGGYVARLRYGRQGYDYQNDAASIRIFARPAPVEETDAIGGMTIDDAVERYAEAPEVLLQHVARKLLMAQLRKAALAAALTAAVGCTVYFGGKVVVRWVRSLSRIEHVRPAPPKPLGGGVVVEGCDRPAGEPEREALLRDTRDIGDSTLVWEAGGILTLARSTERERYIRWGPDTDWHWTWTITIDGAVHTYVTTSPTIRLIGVGGKSVTYTSSAKEWANLSLRGIGTVSVGDANYPIGETPTTDGRVTVSKSGKVTAPDNAHLLNSRETWRAPLIRYDCDAGLTCTFLLAPGPWQPCWQRVVVAFGDGTETDTRSAPPGTLEPRTWPQFLPADERWFGAKDDWDKTRLRATHRYPQSGTYTLAFWVSSADPRDYSGLCDPGPPAQWEEPIRVFKEELRIAPRTSGRYPPKAEM